MKKNMNGAFGALLVAGAAYVWKNRTQLQEQWNRLSGSRTAPGMRQPYALPDSSRTDIRDFSASGVQDYITLPTTPRES